MSNSARPHRQQPTRLPRPWDSPGKNTGVGCHFLLQCLKVKSEREVAQSCPTLGDPMDCSLPGPSIHGIFQARVLEWGAIAFSNIITRVCYSSWPSTNIFILFQFIFLLREDNIAIWWKFKLLRRKCIHVVKNKFPISLPQSSFPEANIHKSRESSIIHCTAPCSSNYQCILAHDPYQYI